MDENHFEKTPRASKTDPEFVLGMLSGFIFQCPLGGNPCHCPARAIRQLPVTERLRWLDSLSVAERLAFYDNHLRCLSHRME
jgi:hypothetical protein